ncbi:MAG: PIN domain-containing protein [Planctomycetaceae bacterium]|nr:PIN domain-containing protein [Planctomycetaceae bacterium]
MLTPKVLYDACVLYPAPLRDLLMHLAVTGLFRACWSNAIHEEWIYHVLKNNPHLTVTQLQRTRQLMDAHALDCLIEGYEDLIETLSLKDQNDRHVLAAAIHGNVSRIVTFNLRDFPKSILDEYEIEAIHPDDFILELLQSMPESVLAAVKRHRISLKNPPKTVDEYLTILDRQQIPQTVLALRNHVVLI